MSANAKIVDPVTGPATLVRPRFSPGLLLRDDDLRQGIEYTRDLSRLLFRSMFGCGVMCGLVVETRIECGKLIVTVNSGVGLTCLGDPVQVPRPATVTIDPTCGKEIPERLWVILCRTEKCCAPRTAACSCDDDDAGTVCTREHDQFEIRILDEASDCACGCPEVTLAPAQQQKALSAKQQKAQAAQKKEKAEAAVAARVVDGQDQIPAPAQGPIRNVRGESCWCADPCSPCYNDHYMGECGCECCDCECVVLALLVGQPDAATGEIAEWKADHSVRRFIRPVLMRDPQVWKEMNPDTDPCQQIVPQ